jgi:hypothetical protein
MDDDNEAIFEVIGEQTGRARNEAVSEITLQAIGRQRCACCGLPAQASFYHLKRRERTLLCGACRPPTRPSDRPTSTE